jgi:hypothetical protein
MIFVSRLKMKLHIAQRQRIHFFQPRILLFIHGRAWPHAPAFYIRKFAITQHMIIQKTAASKCLPQHYPLTLIRFYPESVRPVHRFSPWLHTYCLMNYFQHVQYIIFATREQVFSMHLLCFSLFL